MYIGMLLRDDGGEITLLQSHYVEKVLSGFGYLDCKPSQTPYDPSVLIRKSKGTTIDQLRYSQIVGSLQYLASATRPDIAFAISKLSCAAARSRRTEEVPAEFRCVLSCVTSSAGGFKRQTREKVNKLAKHLASIMGTQDIVS